MNNAVKLQVIAGSGQATADLLEEHADRLKGLENNIALELRSLTTQITTERRIGDDRHVTLGAKFDSLQEEVRALRDEIRTTMKVFAEAVKGAR